MSRRVILLSGFICLCVTRCCSSRLALCDDGKTNLIQDLPGAEELVCRKVWPQPQMGIPDIDTKHIIKAADSFCMDTPITYNDRIPTHGPYRPVEARSGEYLYCPPQRWLNSLKNGALVFLYHPCVSAEAHRSLAVLAHSCLPHYILTPHPRLSQHRPLAVVSWGRSLEMSRVTFGVCDWLLSISSNISQASTRLRPKYNLYLTKPAAVHKPVNTHQEMSKVERLKDFLLLLNTKVSGTSQLFGSSKDLILCSAEDRVQVWNNLRSLKRCCMEALSLMEEQRTRRRTRKIRNVLKKSSEKVELKYDIKPDKLNSTKSAKQNSTDTLPENITKEMASFLMLTVTQSLSSAKDSPEKSVDRNKTKTTDAEKQFPQNTKTHKQSIAEGERHRIKTDTKAQRSGSDCGELGQCGVADIQSPRIEGPLRGERIPIPRTDEAVWAAGALGFLLVLLTLSVLHTRLYRHCRSSTSLYWHDNQQDYENVGDIIRRRLRMVGRRKRRSSQIRRQEYALLLSSNEENSD